LPDSTDWSALNTFEVDIFSLQVFGLLVCRGSVNEKTGTLFDLITRGKKKGVKKLSWAHPKFLKAIKLIFVMAEILPKKYLHLRK
jgi:hypothetical protein